LDTILRITSAYKIQNFTPKTSIGSKNKQFELRLLNEIISHTTVGQKIYLRARIC